MNEKQILNVFKEKDKLIHELQTKIDQLTDDNLHLNELGFDFNCEKFVDECAMRVLQGLCAEFYQVIAPDDHSVIAYDYAEAMLKEKLKRKNDK